MGERVEVTAIEMIYQEDRTLIQIDIYFPDSDKHNRVFIDTDDFFKMISGKK